jgi:hypothetical protein
MEQADTHAGGTMLRTGTAGLLQVVVIICTILLAGCGDDPVTGPAPAPQATTFTATGDVRVQLEAFRAALGAANGGAAGEQAGGRREINWDGSGAEQFNNRNDFPPDFFNTLVKAGAVFTTAGTGFRNDSTLFADVNPAYAAQFSFLSPKKIFSPVGSNQVDQLFRVAGQPTPAVTRGFGVVLSDVDVAARTTIELFARDGSSLGSYAAPVRSDAVGLSFLGVTYEEPLIARVRITLGTGALGAGVSDVSAGGTADLVVLDNVIYGEPRNAF